MEVEDGLLRHVVEIIDLTIREVRDRIIWRSIATSQLGDIAEDVFRQALENPSILKGTEIELAELRQTRNQFALMLGKALKGESIPLPIDQIN
jgi:hypothetical protein